MDRCVGDAIGPGGIKRALHTSPVWLGVLREAERLNIVSYSVSVWKNDVLKDD